MTAEHHIHTCLIQKGQQQTLQLIVAIPSCTLGEGDVQQNNLHGRRAELLALDSTLEPCRHRLAICIISRCATILNITVGLILATIEHDKGRRTLTEHKVGCVGRRGEEV